MSFSYALNDCASALRCHQKCGAGDILPKEGMDGLTMEFRAIANDNPELAVSTVAIKVLTSVIEHSKATTMMGLEKEIKEAAAVLRRYVQTSAHTLSI